MSKKSKKKSGQTKPKGEFMTADSKEQAVPTEAVDTSIVSEDESNPTGSSKKGFFTRLYDKVLCYLNFLWMGVWRYPKRTMGIGIIKTLNLSVRSFMDRGLQNRSMSLTYSTVLAIVPALALLFAIGRGFGFQKLLENQLYSFLPSQRKALETALGFVDQYLSQSSQGVFVGIGIVMLLWTLISLLSTIEDAFNAVWDLKKSRSIYQKVTDYIAICLIVPVLMVCSAGVSIFVNTVLQNSMRLAFLSPLINIGLELTPLFLSWLALSMSYYLIPNTKVNFKYAAIAGGVSAILVTIVQLLFVNGQIYVSKYNAIYGSFSFLPLLLIWLQLSWLILLSGCVLTYSLQNVFSFDFTGKVDNVAPNFTRKVSLVVAVAIVRNYIDGNPPLTRTELAVRYDVPARIVSRICYRLKEAGLIYYVEMSKDSTGLAPAITLDEMTVGELFRRLDNLGDNDFIPRFSEIYKGLLKEIDGWINASYKEEDAILLKDIHLPSPEDVAKACKEYDK